MHELGIAFHIIKDIDKIAEENHVKQVKSVTLELGEVSGVIPEYLVDVWNWANLILRSLKQSLSVIVVRKHIPL